MGASIAALRAAGRVGELAQMTRAAVLVVGLAPKDTLRGRKADLEHSMGCVEIEHHGVQGWGIR